jgi:hypothetical protein
MADPPKLNAAPRPFDPLCPPWPVAFNALPVQASTSKTTTNAEAPSIFRMKRSGRVF